MAGKFRFWNSGTTDRDVNEAFLFSYFNRCMGIFDSLSVKIGGKGASKKGHQEEKARPRGLDLRHTTLEINVTGPREEEEEAPPNDVSFSFFIRLVNDRCPPPPPH